MNNYFVRYWTKDGSLADITVSAYSAMDAQRFVENMPNFNDSYCVDWL